MKFIINYISDSFPFLLVTALIIVAVRYFKCKKSGKFSFKYEAAYLLFWLYMVGVFLNTVVPRTFLQFNFTTEALNSLSEAVVFNNPHQAYDYLRGLILQRNFSLLFTFYILNILLLTPFGFLFPIVYPKNKSDTIIIGVSISCVIEFLQLFTERTTDFFDIFLNFFSVVFGYLLYKLLIKIKNSRSSQ